MGVKMFCRQSRAIFRKSFFFLSEVQCIHNRHAQSSAMSSDNCHQLWNYSPKQDSISVTPEISVVLTASQPFPQATTVLISIILVVPVLELWMDEITQYVLFWASFLLSTIMFWRFTQVVLYCWLVFHCMDHCLFIFLLKTFELFLVIGYYD